MCTCSRFSTCKVQTSERYGSDREKTPPSFLCFESCGERGARELRESLEKKLKDFVLIFWGISDQLQSPPPFSLSPVKMTSGS